MVSVVSDIRMACRRRSPGGLRLYSHGMYTSGVRESPAEALHLFTLQQEELDIFHLTKRQLYEASELS